MPDRRGLIVIAATIVTDSAWLYPLFAILGAGLNLGAPILPWGLIPLLLVLALVGAGLAMGLVSVPARRAPFQAVLGMAVVYLMISALAPGPGLALGWGPRLLTGEISNPLAGSLVLGTLAAGLLWHRGVCIAVETHPGLRLLRSFRSGIVALALSILAEQAFDIDASAMPMLMLLFTVGLAGLAFTHLPPGTAWSPLVGFAVAAVLGGGFVIAMLATVIGGSGLRLLAAGWRYLELVILGLVYLLGWLLELILPDRPTSRREPLEVNRLDFDISKLFDSSQSHPGYYLSGQVIKYALFLGLIYLAYRLLRWAFRVYARQARVGGATERESIRGNADAAADLVNLFLGLLPDWLRADPAPAGRRFPKGIPGITEVYELYFELLAAAREHGHDFIASATPRERSAALESSLPGAPVAQITHCFNAAHYGNLATAPAEIKNLRRQLLAVLNAG